MKGETMNSSQADYVPVLTQHQQRTVFEAIREYGPLFEIVGDQIKPVSSTGLASVICHALVMNPEIRKARQ